MISTRAIIVGAILAATFYLPNALAQSYSFTSASPVDSNWTTMANWSPPGVPGPGDSATIDFSVYNNINFAPVILGTSSITVDNLTIKGTGGTGNNSKYGELIMNAGASMTVTNSITFTHGYISNAVPTFGSATVNIPVTCSLTSDNVDGGTLYNFCDAKVIQSGKTTVNTGLFAYHGGGSINSPAVLDSTAPGARLGFGNNLTTNFNAGMALLGPCYVSGGINVNFAMTTTSDIQLGAAFDGVVGGTGTLNCARIHLGGNSVNGILNIPVVTNSVAADTNILIVNASLISNGTVAVTNAGEIDVNANSTFNTNFNITGISASNTGAIIQIKSGVTLTCNGAVTLNFADFTGSGTLSLSGTSSLTSINGSGANPFNTISPTFITAAPVTVQSGILEFDGGGSCTNTMTAQAGTELGFSGNNTFSFNAPGTFTATATSDVYVAYGAKVSINDSITYANKLILDFGVASSPNSAGTVNGTGSLTITSGGRIAADDFGDVLAVNTTLNVGATLLVDNTSDTTKTGFLTIGANVNCDGTATIKSSTVTINSGCTLACTGAVNFNPPATANAFNTIINGAGTLSSSGTLTSKMNPGASGINVISAAFNNSNIVNVSSGILEMSGGGTNSGSMTATAGTKLGFLTNTYHNSGTLAGTTFVANTTLSLDSPLSFGDTLLLDGTTSGIASSPGTVGGVGPLTITGTGSINANTAGDALNCPTPSVAPGASINVSSGTLSLGADVTSGGATNITNGTLSIASTHTLSSSGAISMNNSANFGGAGTLSVTAGTLVSNNTGIPAASFNYIDCVLTNAAAVSVTNGTLQIENSNGGSSSGSLTVSSGAQLGFYNGNFTIIGTGTLSGGKVFVASDNLIVNTVGALSYGGTLDLDGIGVIANSPGTISGTGSLTLSGALIVQTSGDALNIPSTVTNVGSVTINPGSLSLGADMTCNGTIGVTGGTLSIAVTHRLTSNGAATLNNNGNFGGAGTLTTGLLGSVTSNNTNGAAVINFIDCVLNNTGSVSVTAGVLQVENSTGGTSSGSLSASNGTELGFANGNFAITAGTLSGGTVYVSNDTLSINAAIAYGGTLILDGGTGNPGTVNGSGSLGITASGVLQSNAAGDQLGVTTTVTNGTITVGTSCSLTCTGSLTIDRSGMTGAGTFALSGSGTMSSVNANVGFPAHDNIVGCVFNNAGTVTVTSGALEFDGGGTNTGSFICNAGNQLGFFTTAYINSGAGALSGDVYVASTTLNINNTPTLNGPLHLDGSSDRPGTPGTVAGSGSLNMTGGIFANASGDALNIPTTVTGAGSITVSSGSLSLGATVNCAGPVGITTGSINIALGKTLTCSNAVSMNNNANFGGSGTLSIPLAATLTSSNTNISNTNFIDCNLNNAGAVSVTNGGLQLENSIGGSNSGSITLSNGTQLNLFTCTFANTGTISGGAISLSNATLNENASLIYDGAIGLASSTINIAGAQTLTCNGAVTWGVSSGFGGAGTLSIGSTGSLTGAGAINGNLSNSGLVGLGATIGTLTIGGNFTQNSTGTLHINVGGRSAGQFDVVRLTGVASSATLSGTVDVALINAFVPTITDAFDILTFASKSGAFTATTGASGLTAVYGTTRVTLAKGPPIITSPTMSIGVLGQAFSYTITSNAPAAYTIIGVLPAGLTSNANTIFGTPTQLGVFNLTLTATNILGSSNAPLTITINPPAPVINSPLTASGIVGTAFSYKITASNTPTSYSASDLPAGLTLTADTISGTPTAPGAFNVGLGATNVTGTGTATLVVTIAAPVASLITSPLTANATVGQPFSYSITASGNGQITFAAAPLPAGLTFAVDTISGTPTVAGAIDITLTASNFSGIDTRTLRLIIASAGGSSGTPPAIDSDPTATPNPAVAGQSVVFSSAASDADGDLIAYSWDFGDGMSGNGASTSHTYAVPGLYNATVTVTDGSSSVMASVEVAVNADATTNATLTQFVIQKLSLKLNFALRGKDSLTVSGTLPVAAGFKPSGQSVKIAIGGVQITSTLSNKGISGDKSFKLSGKLGKNGAYSASPVKFSLSLKNQSLASKLNYGTKSNASAPFVMALSLGCENMIAATTLNYIVKAGKSGPASGSAKK